jgi:hypothetical protein
MTTLYGFAGAGEPGPWAKLTMDAEGNPYATTQGSPPDDDLGTVFGLTHSSTGWEETVLHRFTGGKDGDVPFSTVVFDSHGNLYRITNLGGTYTVLMGPGYCDTKESMVNSVTPSTVAWATKTLSKGSL